MLTVSDTGDDKVEALDAGCPKYILTDSYVEVLMKSIATT
jgi:hypothetical protein